MICFSILLIGIISGCGTQGENHESSSSADWASNFVVWNGDIYNILDEEVDPNQIKEKIGEVKEYSDVEGTYGNGFSNKFSAGTILFQIKDIETSDFIAIETEDGLYIQAQNNGKYGG